MDNMTGGAIVGAVAGAVVGLAVALFAFLVRPKKCPACGRPGPRAPGGRWTCVGCGTEVSRGSRRP